ncbi:hypothetical protein CVT24_012864 [Panaeolus cyanescens]|uniref:Uncharacterized protein n=1 Tax=Panaeolus cyanescens TaxID=181874 RepID=A0A409X0L5_9AGAR|nr:hypothetical protein CVT24_012864 [Panaeolus cyanescens]
MANTSHSSPWVEPVIAAVSESSLSSFKPPFAGDVPPPLDKSRGRVYKINGQIYYSPNCSRDGIQEPSVYSGSRSQIRDPRFDKVKEFLKPAVWCSPRTTYLAFMPTYLDMYSPPLTPLSFDVPVHRNSRGFFLDAKFVLSLTRTETELRNIFEDISDYFAVHEILPIAPTALSFEMFFETKKLALKAAERSREWFAMWVGVIAYVIAVAQVTTNDAERPDEPPTWWQMLSRKDTHSANIISSLSMTAFGGFHKRDRVGTFLDILDTPMCQPSVDFFHHFNVPVFYAWGPAEAVTALKNPEIGRLAPLPEQLQAVASYLIIQPSTGGDFMEPWRIHKQQIDEKRQRRILTETPQQRSTRLNRELNPRTSKVPIYVWRNLGGILVRCPSEEDSVLGFGENQRVYNSIDNEWDCSTYFGELEEDEAADMEEAGIMAADSSSVEPVDIGPAYYHSLAQGLDDLHRDMGVMVGADGVADNTVDESPSADGVVHVAPPAVVPNNLLVHPSSVMRVVGLSRPTNSGTFIADALGNLQLHEYEPVDLLLRFAGFRVPLRLPSASKVLHRSFYDKMSKDLGGSFNDDFLRSPVASLALDFWNAITNETVPNVAFWDLSDVNEELRISPHLRMFRAVEVPKGARLLEPVELHPELVKPKKPNPNAKPQTVPPVNHDTIFILDYGNFSTVPWRLAVFSVIDMLMVCRLPPRMTEQDLLQDLVSRGVACQTLLAVSRIPAQLPPPVASVPLRLSGYRFTSADFKAYEDHTRALLQNPRIARAALLSGGILWRVALRYSASIALVTNGPRPQGESFTVCSAGGEYIQDGLHVDEANVLCGLYYVYKSALHREKVSWFPLMTTWRSKNTLSFWTDANERFFDRTEESWKDLEHNQPLSASRWGALIGQSSSVRRADRFIRHHSSVFWDSYRGGEGRSASI